MLSMCAVNGFSPQRKAFSTLQPRFRQQYLCLMSQESAEQKDFHNYLDNSDYEAAFRVLKRNPMITITPKDGQVLLNNLDKLDSSDGDPEKIEKLVGTFLMFKVY